MAVKIYTTPTCGYCKLAKNWFIKKKIDFVEYNVAQDMTKAQEMVKKIYFPRLVIPLSKALVGFVDFAIAMLFFI